MATQKVTITDKLTLETKTSSSFAFNFALSNLLYIMHGIPYIFSAFIVLHSFGFYVTIKIYILEITPESIMNER